MWVKFQDSSTLLKKYHRISALASVEKKNKAKTLTSVRKKPNDSQISFLPKPW